MGIVRKKKELYGIHIMQDNFQSVPPNLDIQVTFGAGNWEFNHGDMYDSADPDVIQIRKTGLYLCQANGYGMGAGGMYRYLKFESDNRGEFYNCLIMADAGGSLGGLNFHNGAWSQVFQEGDKIYFYLRHNAPANVIYRFYEPTGLASPYGFIVQMLDER